MRFLALFLTLAIGLPNPAFALRPAGLEEQEVDGQPQNSKRDLIAALTTPSSAASSQGAPIGNWQNAPLASPAGLEEGYWVELTPQVLGSLQYFDLVKGPDEQRHLVEYVFNDRRVVQFAHELGERPQELSEADVAAGGWHYWVDAIDPKQGKVPGQGVPANDDPEVIEVVIALLRQEIRNFPPEAVETLSQFLRGELEFPIAVRRFAEPVVEGEPRFPEWSGRIILLQAWIAAEYQLPLSAAGSIAFSALGSDDQHSRDYMVASVWQGYARRYEYEREWLTREGMMAVHSHAVRLANEVRVEPVESMMVEVLSRVQEAEESGEWDFTANALSMPESWAVLAILALPGPARIALSEEALVEYVRQLVRALERRLGMDFPLDAEKLRESLLASCAEVEGSIPAEMLRDTQRPQFDDLQYRTAMLNLAAVGGHLVRRTLASIRESAALEVVPQIARLSSELWEQNALFLGRMGKGSPGSTVWNGDLLAPYLEGIRRHGVFRMSLSDAVDYLYSLRDLPAYSGIYLRGSERAAAIGLLGDLSLDQIRDMLAPALKDGWVRLEEYRHPYDEDVSVLVLGEHTPLPGEEVWVGDEAVERISQLVPEQPFQARLSGAEVADAVFLQFPDQLMTVARVFKSDEPLKQDPSVRWHFERYGDVWVVRPVGPMTPEARRVFAKKVGGFTAGLEETTVAEAKAPHHVEIPSAVTERKLLILGPEALGIMKAVSYLRPQDGNAIPLVLVVEDDAQRDAAERWARDLMLPVKEIVSASSPIYSVVPYNGDAGNIVEALARYYASEQGLSPLVALTLEDLLEVASFLGVPDAKSFTYGTNWEIQADLERYNL